MFWKRKSSSSFEILKIERSKQLKNLLEALTRTLHKKRNPINGKTREIIMVEINGWLNTIRWNWAHQRINKITHLLHAERIGYQKRGYSVHQKRYFWPNAQKIIEIKKNDPIVFRAFDKNTFNKIFQIQKNQIRNDKIHFQKDFQH